MKVEFKMNNMSRLEKSRAMAESRNTNYLFTNTMFLTTTVTSPRSSKRQNLYSVTFGNLFLTINKSLLHLPKCLERQISIDEDLCKC